MNDDMCYVAADPKQPGAGWAFCIDDPRWIKSTAVNISNWVKDGAKVEYVTEDVALDMLKKWVRPDKEETK